MRIEYQVDIEAPAELVWPFVGEPERWPLWMPDLHSMTCPDGLDHADVVGTRLRQVIRRRRGVEAWEGVIVVYDPCRRFAIRLASDGRTLDIDMRLGPMGTGTCLAYDALTTAESYPARLAVLLRQPFDLLLVSRSMARLKRLSEESVTAPSPAPARDAGNSGASGLQ